jgi:hypothetical protein
MEYNCPVCNKVGLPDFKNQHTICPQCNSDLKPYLILHSNVIIKPNSIIITITTAVVIIAILFALFYYNSANEKQRLISENLENVNALQDSIKTLQAGFIQFINTQSRISTVGTKITIAYKIKKGDCSSKIAEFFYNDWRMYKKIETDNNLKEPYILKIGQTLNINLTIE